MRIFFIFNVILFGIIVTSCNTAEVKNNKCEIVPGERFNGIKLGQSIEDVLDFIKQEYDFETQLDEINFDLEIKDSIKLVFNKRLKVLSQILLYNSKYYVYKNVSIGDSFESITKKLDLIQSDLEVGVFKIVDVEGLYLEFEEDWTLDCFNVYNEQYLVNPN